MTSTARGAGREGGMDVVDVFEHRGEFFTVLQETTRSQTE